MNKSLGQYFTTHTLLLKKVFEFIKNDPHYILEPSIGRGHIVEYIQQKIKNCRFKMIEIDESLITLESINKNNLIYNDFLNYEVNETFDTIIGNPPFNNAKKDDVKGGEYNNLWYYFVDKSLKVNNKNGLIGFIHNGDWRDYKTNKFSVLEELK